jgi:hypothetical protein
VVVVVVVVVVSELLSEISCFFKKLYKRHRAPQKKIILSFVNSCQFSDTGLGLFLRDLLQSDAILCRPVLRFIWKFKMTSHIEAPSLREKPLLAF